MRPGWDEGGFSRRSIPRCASTRTWHTVCMAVVGVRGEKVSFKVSEQCAGVFWVMETGSVDGQFAFLSPTENRP